MKIDSDEGMYSAIREQAKIDDLLYRLYKAEGDEDSGIYLLGLHLDSGSDFDFFSEDEKEKIKGLLGLLVEDTSRHAILLGSAVRELKEKKVIHAS